MADHHKLGELGETIAADHLVFNGYEIKEINWRHQKAEVDLIAVKGNLWVFIEVKTRATAAFGRPEEFVTEKKLAMMADAAGVYLEGKSLEVETRFDVIGIVLKHDNQFSLNHFEDVYFPGL